MSETKNLPTVGAALRISQLADHADWLIEGQRDLEIQDAIWPNLMEQDWKGMIAEAKEVLNGHSGRIGVHGPFIDISIAPWDPWAVEFANKRISGALEFAGELGATHMVLHSPFDYFGAPHTIYATESSVSAVIDRTKALLEPLLPKAEEIGLTFVIETIRDKDTGPLLTLIRSFESDNVRLSIDTGHCRIHHLMGGASADTWVDAAGDLLAHVHVQDTDGLADRHWAPGDGAINWYAFFQALEEVNSDPRLVLELSDKNRIPKGYQWLVENGFAK